MIATETEALEIWFAEVAVQLTRERRGLPVRINSLAQRQLKPPLEVVVTSDGVRRSTICAFTLNTDGSTSDWRWLRTPTEADWPFLIKVTAQDGEWVSGVCREHSWSFGERFIPRAS
jgi:hypothetical protein